MAGNGGGQGRAEGATLEPGESIRCIAQEFVAGIGRWGGEGRAEEVLALGAAEWTSWGGDCSVAGIGGTSGHNLVAHIYGSLSKK